MNKIQEGEVVVVTGETRRMTVDEVTVSSAHCCWLDEYDQVQSNWFLLGAIEVVE